MKQQQRQYSSQHQQQNQQQQPSEVISDRQASRQGAARTGEQPAARPAGASCQREKEAAADRSSSVAGAAVDGDLQAAGSRSSSSQDTCLLEFGRLPVEQSTAQQTGRYRNPPMGKLMFRLHCASPNVLVSHTALTLLVTHLSVEQHQSQLISSTSTSSSTSSRPNFGSSSIF